MLLVEHHEIAFVMKSSMATFLMSFVGVEIERNDTN